MPVPKIIFKRSWIYDQIWRPLRKKDQNPPKNIDAKIRLLEQRWNQKGSKILSEMEKITRLKWHERETSCYVTWGIQPFSDPLTLNGNNDVDDLFNILTHEMIHRLVSEKQNWSKIKTKWQKFQAKHKKEKPNTRSHIPIHAIHQHLFETLVGEKMFEKEKAICEKYPEYKRTWEIVEKLGYKNIIKEIFT